MLGGVSMAGLVNGSCEPPFGWYRCNRDERRCGPPPFSACMDIHPDRKQKRKRKHLFTYLIFDQRVSTFGWSVSTTGTAADSGSGSAAGAAGLSPCFGDSLSCAAFSASISRCSSAGVSSSSLLHSSTGGSSESLSESCFLHGEAPPSILPVSLSSANVLRWVRRASSSEDVESMDDIGANSPLLASLIGSFPSSSDDCCNISSRCLRRPNVSMSSANFSSWSWSDILILSGGLAFTGTIGDSGTSTGAGSTLAIVSVFGGSIISYRSSSIAAVSSTGGADTSTSITGSSICCGLSSSSFGSSMISSGTTTVLLDASVSTVTFTIVSSSTTTAAAIASSLGWRTTYAGISRLFSRGDSRRFKIFWSGMPRGSDAAFLRRSVFICTRARSSPRSAIDFARSSDRLTKVRVFLPCRVRLLLKLRIAGCSSRKCLISCFTEWRPLGDSGSWDAARFLLRRGDCGFGSLELVAVSDISGSSQCPFERALQIAGERVAIARRLVGRGRSNSHRYGGQLGYDPRPLLLQYGRFRLARAAQRHCLEGGKKR
uniref:Uncharacterized protein n=1 Tax=Anopheles melas TaxID=34690 RepID=A0A182TQZ2_9DIPT